MCVYDALQIRVKQINHGISHIRNDHPSVEIVQLPNYYRKFKAWRAREKLRHDGKKNRAMNRARISVGKVAKETRKDGPQLREQRDTYPLSANRIIELGSLPALQFGTGLKAFGLLDLDRCRHLKSVNWRSTAVIISNKMDTKSPKLKCEKMAIN